MVWNWLVWARNGWWKFGEGEMACRGWGRLDMAGDGLKSLWLAGSGLGRLGTGQSL